MQINYSSTGESKVRANLRWVQAGAATAAWPGRKGHGWHPQSALQRRGQTIPPNSTRARRLPTAF